MKKIKLLLAALAAMVGLGANAQTWTAQAPADGDFYLFNVGTGKYLSCGEDWGTHAVVGNGALKFTLANNGSGAYTLYTTSTFSYGDPNSAQLQSNGYVDQNVNATTWTFNAVDGKVNTYTLLNAAGDYLYAPSDASTIKIYLNSTEPTNANGYWKLINYDNLFENATEVDPVDVTCLIGDANFESSKATSNLGWTMTANKQNLCGGTSPNKCAESWQSSNGFTLSQTITVPNGNYKLRAQAAVTEYNVTGVDLPVIYLNEATVAFNTMTEGEDSQGKMSEQFTAGKYWTDYTSVVTVTNNTITLGARGTRNDTWNVWDNFQLLYLGVDLSALRDALQDQINSVAALEGTTTTDAYNYAKDYADGIDVSALMTEAEIAEASTELTSRVNAANALVANYSRYKNIRTAILAINGGIDISAANTAVEAATTNEAVVAAVATLRAALSTYLASAGIADDQIDLTAAMIDNAAPYTNADYWTVSETPAFDATNRVAEFWNKSGASIRQVVEDLPVGYYRLTAIALGRPNHNGKLSANEFNVNLVGHFEQPSGGTASGGDWFNEGNGVNELLFNLDSSTDVTIGITADNANGDHWTLWRSFKLEYLGTAPVEVFKDLLQEAIDNGRTAVAALSVPTGVKTAFTSTANTYETAKSSYTTVSQCETAIDAIAAAVAAAEAAVSPTAMNAVVLAKAVTTAALDDLDDADEAVLQDVIDDNTEDLAACTTAAEVEAQNAALWSAIGVAINTIELAGDETLNLTYLLTNPDLTGLPTWTGADGWYTDQTEGNSQVMTNDKATSEDGTKIAFYEYWTYTAQANNKFALYQKVTLPEGTYSISCYAFAQDEFARTNTVGVYFYANDTQGSSVTTARLTEASIDFVNDSDQDVKIGLKTISPNSYNWMGIGYVELFKTAPKTIAINENANYTPESVAGTVNLARTIKANTWNTFVVPFALNYDELKDAFGSDVEVAEFSDSGESSDAVTVSFTKMGTPAITANTPVLLKTSTAGTSYSFTGRTVVAGTPAVTGTYLDFVGTYDASTTIASGDFFISGNKLYKSSGATTIQGTRAYLHDKSGAGVKAMLFIDDEATSIDAINGVEAENGVIYNIAGQRLNKVQKGINIVNGKKVLY